MSGLRISDLVAYLDAYAPSAYQESYDNVGLLVGDSSAEVKGVLTSLDVTESVLAEGIRKGCNVIVSHHPIIFQGFGRLTGRDASERVVMAALGQGVALYASHTNLDNLGKGGVNDALADQMGLVERRVLVPKADTLCELSAFVPRAHTKKVLSALHEAGAGHIGKYRHCSFRTTGTGAFTPEKDAKPHLGKPLKAEETEEERIEVLFPRHLQTPILHALHKAHPYEEVAYYVYPIRNEHPSIGSGIIGKLHKGYPPKDFLALLKEKIPAIEVIAHTPYASPIQCVAICTGAGYSCLNAAKRAHADAFVSADFTYHRFFEADNKLMICDIGHYESEIHVKELLYMRIKEKFPNIAVHQTECITKPIRYYF